jgi:hypothetical protein
MNKNESILTVILIVALTTCVASVVKHFFEPHLKQNFPQR